MSLDSQKQNKTQKVLTFYYGICSRRSHGIARAGSLRGKAFTAVVNSQGSLFDVRGLRRLVPPLVVDLQRKVELVHDANGDLLRLHGWEVVATSAFCF